MNLKEVLRAGSVIRYHSTMIDKKQRVDSHSWEVAIILAHIYGPITSDLMLYALTHDCSEQSTGDIPAPVKRDKPELKDIFDELEDEYMRDVLSISHPEFTLEEKLAVKYADIISGIYFTTCRVNAGDREAIPIRDKWIEYASSLPFLNEACEEIIEELKQ